VAVYSVGENFTPVLLSAMHTCFMSHLLVLALKELALGWALLQLVLTTTLHCGGNRFLFGPSVCACGAKSRNSPAGLPLTSSDVLNSESRHLTDTSLYTQGDSDVISMLADFRRHLVGKTLINVCHCDIAEIRFVGKIVIIQTFS